MDRIGGIALFVVLTLGLSAACQVEEAVEKETSAPVETQAVVKDVVPDAGVQKTAANSTSKEPRIEFAQTEFDFGEVEAGEKVQHTFSFKNVGDADLVIAKVRSS